MTSSLLSSIVRLFGIVAQLDTYDDRLRSIVERFLSARVKLDDLQQYLTAFERDRHKDYAAGSGDKESAMVGQITQICSAVNGELSPLEKLDLLLAIIEMIAANQAVTSEEDLLLGKIADALKMPSEDFQAIRCFAFDLEPQAAQSDCFVTINGTGLGTGKVLAIEGFQGVLRVLRLGGIRSFLVKYSGEASYFMDAQVLTSGAMITFPIGGIIKGSRIKPIYYSTIVSHFAGKDGAHRISFEANDVAFDFPNGRRGLHQLTIREESGALVGIMGPSGAGKSTMLEILNGNAKPTEGQLVINGLDYHANKESLQNLIGYVPQDDLLIEDLTVYENLYYAAQLSFGNASQEQLDHLVMETLLNLGIKDIAHLKVGSPLQKIISGGERKRVNIALELLRKPGILFLDEPTSGLSSRNSLSIMDLLKQLTAQEKLIFVVIHQPSSDIFKMFDKLIILDKGGYMIYYGNPVESISYFKSRINHIKSQETVCIECSNVNPEQVFDIIETRVINEEGLPTHDRKVSPADWYALSRDHLEVPAPLEHAKAFTVPGKKASWWQQVQVFTARNWKAKSRNSQYLAINGLQTPFLALILAYANRYYDTSVANASYSFSDNVNIPGYFFISIIIGLFTGLTVSAEEIFSDRKILKREAFLKLSYSSYLTSKLITLFLLSAIQMLALVLLGNSILGIEGLTWQYWLVLFSSSCMANLIGLNLSATFNSAVTIYILIPIILIPQLILGGVVIPYNHMNPALQDGNRVPIYGEVMASRWGYEALMVEQFKNNPYAQQFYEFEKTMAHCDFQRNQLLPFLTAKVEDCRFALSELAKDPTVKERLADNLAILRKAISHQQTNAPEVATGQWVESLQVGQFDSKTADAALKYFEGLMGHYSRTFSQAFEEKSQRNRSLINKPNGAAELATLKGKFYNQAVADIVKGRGVEEYVTVEDGELVEKSNPIYNAPKPTMSWDFRAHFLSPVKQFMGTVYETLYFNVAVIWGMSALLYLMLYYKGLKAMLALFNLRRKRR